MPLAFRKNDTLRDKIAVSILRCSVALCVLLYLTLFGVIAAGTHDITLVSSESTIYEYLVRTFVSSFVILFGTTQFYIMIDLELQERKQAIEDSVQFE